VVTRLILAFAVAMLGALTAPVRAQELLSNRSFETPAAPANGNNFYATIPDWTIVNVTAAQPQPFNVILAWSGYDNNPSVTPTGGGAQYLDVNSASGSIRQTITVPSNGMIDISGWFSVRDYPQVLDGLNINIRKADGTLVATTGTSFSASDPIGLWKLAATSNIPLAAGSYIFEVDIPDFANVDLMSAVFKPALSLTKSSAPYSDPQNGTANPKLIPGSVAEYTIAVTSPPSYTVSSNTIALSDVTPANAELIVADIGGTGSGPAGFAAGTSTMTYSFASLASTTDDIDFSNNNGSSWTYSPVVGPNGADPAVTTVRVRPQGAMAPGSTAIFRLRYRIR
jgi:hypothetical protein